jgi:hypothetical protein
MLGIIVRREFITLLGGAATWPWPSASTFADAARPDEVIE